MYKILLTCLFFCILPLLGHSFNPDIIGDDASFGGLTPRKITVVRTHMVTEGFNLKYFIKHVFPRLVVMSDDVVERLLPPMAKLLDISSDASARETAAALVMGKKWHATAAADDSRLGKINELPDVKEGRLHALGTLLGVDVVDPAKVSFAQLPRPLNRFPGWACMP